MGGGLCEGGSEINADRPCTGLQAVHMSESECVSGRDEEARVTLDRWERAGSRVR